jgi:hypothetical protein
MNQLKREFLKVSERTKGLFCNNFTGLCRPDTEKDVDAHKYDFEAKHTTINYGHYQQNKKGSWESP